MGLGGIGFISLVLSVRFGAILKLIAGIIFFALAVVMLAEYDIAYTEKFTGTAECPTNDPCVTQKFLVEENGSWLGWIFVIFGIVAIIMFFYDLISKGY